MPSTAIYRALMMTIEARRIELGLSMAQIDEIAGFSERYYSKMIYPDTPSGRQAQWQTVDEAVTSLFGNDFQVQIVPGADLPRITLSAVSDPTTLSRKSINIRHWRHTKHFKELGARGGKARAAKLTPERRTAIAKKANRAWRKARKAQRDGAKHVAANANANRGCDEPS